MTLDIVYLIIGLALILFGANWLTDGSAAIARRFGISDLIVGLTVVAFGTSAPELVISVMSAINGSAGLAIGNVVGSNLFNILVIIGVTAMIRPIAVDRSVMTNELPLVLLSSLALLAMGNSATLDATSSSVLTRVDGILLMLFFAIFMRYTFAQARSIRQPQDDPAADAAAQKPQIPMAKASLLVIAGLAGLIAGGDRFVAGASGIAAALGVSDALIGLTIVAMGTSLPELAASIVAAIKGRPGLAIGNVIGSCIFNAFFILGTAAVIRPLPFGSIGNVDLLALCGASLLFWIFARIYRVRTITRPEGILMAALYIAYTAWLIAMTIR